MYSNEKIPYITSDVNVDVKYYAKIVGTILTKLCYLYKAANCCLYIFRAGRKTMKEEKLNNDAINANDSYFERLI